MNLINTLLEILTGKCGFKNKCAGYTKRSATCNKDAGEYCGMYRNFLTIK